MLTILSGCATNQTSEHASRQQAESFLRKEGLLTHANKIVSAKWHEDLNEWVFLVEYTDENGRPLPGHWFVSSTATDYSGGTCQH